MAHEHCESIWKNTLKTEIFETNNGRILQTVLNLLSNACKFTENGVIDLIINRTKRKYG